MRLRALGIYTVKFLGIFVGLILLYLLAAYVLSKITVNAGFSESKDDPVYIFVRTNGVHSDIVLPLTNDMINWPDYVNPHDTKSQTDAYNYVAFAWGDRGFYLETPTWADLKFSTAFKALFFLSSSAMHVSFYYDISESNDCKKISISKEQYLMITAYVKSSFKMDNNKPVLIKDASFARNDSFYEANGTYSLFFTSNTWTNAALKYANLKACLWTPFDREILNKYTLE